MNKYRILSILTLIVFLICGGSESIYAATVPSPRWSVATDHWRKFPYQNQYNFSTEPTRAIQILLMDFNPNFNIELRDKGGADGSFGPATVEVVQHYQNVKGLAQDGSVGPDTWASFRSNLTFSKNADTNAGYLTLYQGNGCLYSGAKNIIGSHTNKSTVYWYHNGVYSNYTQFQMII